MSLVCFGMIAVRGKPSNGGHVIEEDLKEYERGTRKNEINPDVLSDRASHLGKASQKVGKAAKMIKF